jgi:hypothetical protein
MTKSKLALLKSEGTDRKKVEAWLDSIQEFDPAIRAEVLDACAKDKEARAYFVMRSGEVGNG